MLNVYFLRHGQTQYNAEGNRYCGRTDIPLTPRGIQQAELVREQLSRISFEAVYSSPLLRALKTAQVAAGGKDVLTDDRLIEVDFGNWESKKKEEFFAENPSLWNDWENDPTNTKAGGTGETALEVVTRVEDFFRYALVKHPSGNILVVAHNGVNRLYLAYKLGMPLKNYRKLVQENSTASMFELNETGELTLVHLNSNL